MENKIICKCCRNKNATIKDYRFIDSIGCQGSILVCDKCFNLNDEYFIKAFLKGHGYDEIDYKRGFEILLEYFDCIPEDERELVDKRLKVVGL